MPSNFKNQKINKKEIYKWGIGAGIAEIAYVLIIASIMMLLDRFVSPPGSQVISILFVLLLLVFSTAVSAFFVFGYPLHLFLDKKIKQSILTFLVTLLTLFVGVILLLILILSL